MKKKFLAAVITLALVAVLLVGCKGAEGLQGLRGPAGPQGAAGIQGDVGPQGEAGSAGLMGKQGPQGEPGTQGEIGPAGAEGARGPSGAGSKGSTGATGATGPAGPAGSDADCDALEALIDELEARLHILETQAPTTMVFQSVGEYTLTYNPVTETYSGMIPMVVGGGYDVYAENGATAWFGSPGPVWTPLTIADHDAWPDWDPDTPDWYQYSLNFYEDGKWRMANHSGATEVNPWYDDVFWVGSKIEQGIPMSGTMDWNAMYAAETDVGEYLLGSGGVPGIEGGAESKGGGLACWDMDWSWGSEVIPLQFPGFIVQITDLGADVYCVTLTPAPAP